MSHISPKILPCGPSMVTVMLAMKSIVLVSVQQVYNNMLPIEKSKDLIEQINRILRRMTHIRQVRQQQSDFLAEVQELFSSYAQRIHKQMTLFEETVIKNTLYSASKANPIVNFAKLFRDFALTLDRNARLNLLSLQRIRVEELSGQQQRLSRKCELFLKEFQGYLGAEKVYNLHYSAYSDKCTVFDQTIRRYRSYQEPLAFYNHTRTTEYIAQLDRHFNDCSNFETTVVNDTQGLDQTRKWMGDHVKQINQHYVILLHVFMGVVHATVNAIVQPNPDSESTEKAPLALRSSKVDSHSPAVQVELQKLNNLYSSQLNNQQNLEDNLAEDYSQLFKKNFTQELNSDSKFFYDRCEGMRGKKLKTTEQVLRIQKLLLEELARQVASHASFEKSSHVIDRDIFTNNGIDAFKKRFRKYFGSNFTEVQELCFAIVERQKRALQRIAKSTEECRQKLSRLIQGKEQSVKFFQKRTRTILDDHLRLKQKTQCKSPFQCDIKTFKDSITGSFQQLKKSFQELQKGESEIDVLFFSTLKAHCEVVRKEGVVKNFQRLLEKEKIRVNILRSLNVDSEIILILKEDSRYEMLMNQCPKPNLYASFQSLAKKKEYDQTKRLLQMKEDRLKGMIQSKAGCCGVTSQLIKRDIKSEHSCKLVANGQKAKGMLHVTASGLTFQQISWNPFADTLRLAIPETDIQGFDTRSLNEKEVVEVNTDFGSLFFQSSSCSEIVESMQKNIKFKPGPGREGSERGKRNDSSSILKNNTSTQFKLSYENHNGSSTEAFRQQKDANSKTVTKPKNSDILKDFIRKWKEDNFLSEHFTRIIKNLPEKGDSRRDYQYVSGANRFVLKQRRQATIEGKDVVFIYDWKVCFPDTPMLHSFKHGQRVHIEGINKDLRVRIVTNRLTEQQLFIRNKFYREIEEMNERLAKFVVDTLQKEADVLIQPEQGEKSINSSDIILQEINDQKLDKQEAVLRSSRLQRQKSGNIPSSSILRGV